MLSVIQSTSKPIGKYNKIPTKQNKMKVSEKIVSEWAGLKERGDNQELAKLLGLTEPNVSRIVTTGIGNTKHIAKIKKFFERKRALIKQLAEEQD